MSSQYTDLGNGKVALNVVNLGSGGGGTGGTSLTEAQVKTAIESSSPTLTGQAMKVGTSYNSAPSSNTAAVISLAATTGKRWAIYQIEVSYAQLPTNGVLTITESGGEKYRLFITTAGAAPIVSGRLFTSGAGVVVTLSAGGAGVSGAINLSAEVI